MPATTTVPSIEGVFFISNLKKILSIGLKDDDDDGDNTPLTRVLFIYLFFISQLDREGFFSFFSFYFLAR